MVFQCFFELTVRDTDHSFT